jgi:hypothetical protein
MKNLLKLLLVALLLTSCSPEAVENGVLNNSSGGDVVVTDPDPDPDPDPSDCCRKVTHVIIWDTALPNGDGWLRGNVYTIDLCDDTTLKTTIRMSSPHQNPNVPAVGDTIGQYLGFDPFRYSPNCQM